MPAKRKIRLRRVEPVNRDNQVVAHILCIKCGTDAFGRSIDETCTVCKHPIYDSVYGGYLIDASPFEVRRVYDMSRLVYYPSLLVAALSAIAILTTAFGASSFLGAIYSLFNVGLFCAMLYPVIAIVGLVTFTSRHSVGYYRARYGRPSFIMRASVAVVAVLVVTAMGAANYNHVTGALAIALFCTVPIAAFLQRLGSLMRRVPNKKLATFSNLACWLACTLGTAALAILIMRPLAQPNSPLAEFVAILTFAAVMGGLGLGIMGIRLLIFARRTLLAIRH